ncbi:MAG: GNAT family N-acetyltransferase [Acetatifactor sp.]|nr:GNAT family N-acetyltransferase [Acetatifactor sp.]
MEKCELITLEILDKENWQEALCIDREDISLDFVDSVEGIIELTRYGEEHNCIGHTYLIRLDGQCVGIILMGEGIPWEVDPPQIAGRPFYRIMGFIIDRAYRRRGIGSYVLEEVIQQVYQEFGSRPIVIGCHVDNVSAMEMYQRHGFVNTFAMDEDDWFLIREA